MCIPDPTEMNEPRFTITETSSDIIPLITVERSGKHLDAISLFLPDAPANQRRWRFVIDNSIGDLVVEAWDDAQLAHDTMRVERVGNLMLIQPGDK